jgi:hypothetical protein
MAKSSSKSARRKAPWKKTAPKGSRHAKLSPSQKAKAKRAAKRAGRPYPNLVDNMRAAKKRKKATRKTTRKPTSSRKATKSPKGGLTAAGRAQLRRTEGAHLRPGVKKSQREMTLAEMRRKGSWAVRFYGRKKLPSLLTSDGKPTRFALTAAAWGEAIPRTVAAARRIAAKGKRLLATYKRKREQAGRSTSGGRAG